MALPIYIQLTNEIRQNEYLNCRSWREADLLKVGVGDGIDIWYPIVSVEDMVTVMGSQSGKMFELHILQSL